MHFTRQELLARTTLSVNEHRHIRCCHLVRGGEQLLHASALSKKASELSIGSDLAA